MTPRIRHIGLHTRAPPAATIGVMAETARVCSDRRAATGWCGEQAAAAHLSELGWRIAARNARTRYGELDLVCCAGEALVFVEVKALRGGGAPTADRALQSIRTAKQLRIRRLARAWLAENRSPCRWREVRFDAIGVSIDACGRANGLTHVRDAF